MTELSYETMVHEGLRRNREQRLPDGSPIVSSPVTSTLIYGAHDAVLVDPPFTRDQVQRVARVDGNLRLVVRERIVAVELHVRRCLGNAALQLRLRSMLLIEAGALNRTFAGHPFRKVDLGARAPGDTEGQDCKGTRQNQPSMHYSPSSAPLGLTEG